ncbi:protein phosphatase 1 regulatory subunit 3C-B-like [Halichoeres trimaculatus]|uniref:protein phosphatase 1 regulatory subunit 3C-B-like n=1 Tax=Halichoeres trimaculatus TaxID=147232 RepID=UPI003D9DCE04
MTCTRVLSAMGSHPQPLVTPVDLAMRLSQRQPLYELLSMSPLKPAEQSSRPAHCLQRAATFYSSSRSPSSPRCQPSLLPSAPVTTGPRSCFRRDSSGQTKKRVVFADAKGLALTAVRLFIPDSSIPAPTVAAKPIRTNLQTQQWPSDKLQKQPPLIILQQQSSTNKSLRSPPSDLDSSLARLREMRVQLESCTISGNCLSGRVRVSHVGAEKAVHVRVTFDSWQSHHDIPCTYLQEQRFGGSEVQYFAFDLNLPKNADPEERVEFCVYLRTGAGTATHWDDNNGQNYRVYVEKDRANANQGNANGYSTLSKYQPLSWPSHVPLGLQNYGDPLYFQNSLSSRIRAEWDSVFS